MTDWLAYWPPWSRVKGLYKNQQRLCIVDASNTHATPISTAMKIQAYTNIWCAACCASMVYLIRKPKYIQYDTTAIIEEKGVIRLTRRFHVGIRSTSSLMFSLWTRQTECLLLGAPLIVPFVSCFVSTSVYAATSSFDKTAYSPRILMKSRNSILKWLEFLVEFHTQALYPIAALFHRSDHITTMMMDVHEYWIEDVWAAACLVQGPGTIE